MAQVKIKLDVWNDAALKNIEVTNQKLIQLQVNGQNITIGNNKQVQAQTSEVKKLDAQIKKVEKSSKQAGQSASQTLTKNQQKVSGLTKEFKQISRGVNDLIHSFINPMTIILVLVEAATKTFKYFWDNLTENIDKLTARSNGAIKNAQRQIKQADERAKATTDLIKKLDQLNQLQNLNNEQQRLGQSILARLNRQYGDLGITLDETTGKYNNLYEAQIKVDELNKEQQARGLRAQAQAQRGNINAALKKAFGSGIELGKPIDGDDLFTIAEKMGSTFGAQNADVLAKAWGPGTDFNAMRDVVYQLQQGLAQGQNVTSLQQVIDAFDIAIDYAKQLNKLNSATRFLEESSNRLAQSLKKQRDALKGVEEQTERINQSIEDQQRANSLAGLDPEDRIRALNAEADALEKRNKELQNLKGLVQKQLNKKQADSYSDLIDYDYLGDELKAVESRSIKQKKELQQLEKKILNNRQKVQKWYKEVGSKQGSNIDWSPVRGLTEQTVKLDQRAKQIRRNQVADNKRIVQLKQNIISQQAKYEKSQSDILKTKTKIAELDRDIAKNQKTAQSLRNQSASEQAQLDKERAEAELARLQAQQDRIKNYSNFVNDLMHKQIEGLNAILGKRKENLLLELQLNAEKIKGRKLTEEQLNALKKHVDVMTMQDELKNNLRLNFNTNGVITNDLARKGGWASSVVVDRAQDINKQILEVEKNQNELISKLNDTMKTSQELLEKYSVIQ